MAETRKILPLEDPESGRRHQSAREEIANSVSHGLGLLACMAGFPFLLKAAARHGTVAGVVGVTVFSGTLIFLYLSSALYHAWPVGPAKHRFRIMEHIAIFFLIAGTYTPFCLGVLRGPWGWSLLGVTWGLTLAGVILKAIGGFRHPKISTSLYLLMGWVVLVAVQPLWTRISPMGFAWLVAGGLAYTLGVVFFSYDHRWRYSHFIWHLFVLAGSLCHYVAILRYAR